MDTLDNQPATFIAIYQQPGANGLTVSKAVRAAVNEMNQRMPDGMKIVVSLDTTDFVRLSIKVIVTLKSEALVLVVIVPTLPAEPALR